MTVSPEEVPITFGVVDVLEADNGADALRLLDENGGVDLVLTDLVMPRMTGRELAARLQERTDRPPVLFMSGYSEEDVIGGADAGSAVAILEKPFTVQQLGAAVASVLSKRRDQRGD